MLAPRFGVVPHGIGPTTTLGRCTTHTLIGREFSPTRDIGSTRHGRWRFHRMAVMLSLLMQTILTFSGGNRPIVVNIMNTWCRYRTSTRQLRREGNP